MGCVHGRKAAEQVARLFRHAHTMQMVARTQRQFRETGQLLGADSLALLSHRLNNN